jgi:hypothetical protein
LISYGLLSACECQDTLFGEEYLDFGNFATLTSDGVTVEYGGSSLTMQTHLIDTISSNCGPSPTGLAYCGARSFTITNDSSSSSDTTLFQGSYDSATGVLTITV